MRDLYELGSTPNDEECVQVTKEGGYELAMKAECERYKAMLELRFPELPYKVYFQIKRNSHDFGTYYEVAVVYDDENEESTNAMVFIDNNLPKLWTDKEVFTEIPFDESDYE